MTEHTLRYAYSEPPSLDDGHIYVWDADLDYHPSPPISKKSIRNWLGDTQLGWFDSLPGFGGPYRCVVFKDRESKVLFKMAFDIP